MQYIHINPDIDECTRPDEFPCHGECTDNDGSYDCQCPRGYQSDGDPKEKPCHPKLSNSAKLIIGVLIHTLVLQLFRTNDEILITASIPSYRSFLAF